MKSYIDKSVTDIFLVGSVESKCNNVHQGLLFYEMLYVEFNDVLMCLTSDSNKSELNLKSKKKIELNFEIDEDDDYLKLSIFDLLVLDTVSDNKLSRINKYFVGESLKAIEFELNSKQSIFIDGTYYTGMKVGDKNIKQNFFLNHSSVIVQEFKSST